MRGSFAKEIFKQDLLQIYSEQTKRRNILTKQSQDTMREIIAQINIGICENKIIEELITHLAERLKHTSGKKQYGYLKAPLKVVIDQIVDELAGDERVAECYAKWYELRNDVLRTYADKLPPPLPLSKQKEFKSIKNMVITEALHIGGHHFTFEPVEETEASVEEMAENADENDGELSMEEESLTVEASIIDTADDITGSGPEPTWEEASEDDEPAEFHCHVAWSDRYKEARAFLYGKNDLEPDFVCIRLTVLRVSSAFVSMRVRNDSNRLEDISFSALLQAFFINTENSMTSEPYSI